MSGCPAELIERDTRTCAEWRKEAQRLEDNLDWGAAAGAWDMAITRHPGHNAKPGTMDADDLCGLVRRRRCCLRTHYSEAHADYKGTTDDGRKTVVARHPLGWSQLLVVD